MFVHTSHCCPSPNPHLQRCVGCSRCTSCSAASITSWLLLPHTSLTLPTTPAKLSDIPTHHHDTTLSSPLTSPSTGGDTTTSSAASKGKGGGEEEEDTEEEEEGRYIGLCSRCLRLRKRRNYCPLCQGCYEDDDYDARVSSA